MNWLGASQMRIGWVIVGVVLVILGAVLLFVPVVPQASETVSSSSDTPYYVGQVSGFSLTGTIAVSVTWSAPSSVSIVAGACTSACANGSASNSSVTDLTLQSGTSGSFTLNQPNGGYIVMGVVSSNQAPTNATFTITTALATVGTVLVPVGVLVLIVGVIRKKKTAAPAPATTAVPSDAPAAPAPPPPSS